MIIMMLWLSIINFKDKLINYIMIKIIIKTMKNSNNNYFNKEKNNNIIYNNIIIPKYPS